jgi:hypothetical protein
MARVGQPAADGTVGRGRASGVRKGQWAGKGRWGAEGQWTRKGKRVSKGRLGERVTTAGRDGSTGTPELVTPAAALRGTPEPVTPAAALRGTPEPVTPALAPIAVAEGHTHASSHGTLPRVLPRWLEKRGAAGCPPRRSSPPERLSGRGGLGAPDTRKPSDPFHLMHLHRHPQDRPHALTVPTRHRFPAPVIGKRLDQLKPPAGLLVLVRMAHGRRAEY